MAAPAGTSLPPPLPSTTSILRKSLSTFLSSLPALLLVSLLILCLRSALLAGTLRLSSLPETDPLLRSLLSSLSAPSSSTSSSTSPPYSTRFLRPSPAAPLPDDFFSSSPFIPRRSLTNSSFNSPIPLFLSHNSIPWDRARIIPADPGSRILFSLPDSENADRAVKGFSLGKNGLELVYILSLLSTAHAIALIGFILCYAFALGVVFHCVARSVLSRPVISLTHVLRSGARIGVRRLVGFVFLKWAIRDAIVQLLCIWFFANVDDQSKLFKLFIKAKLIPFSLTVISGNDDPQLHGFLFMWGLVDSVVSIFLVLVPWVVVVDGNVGMRGQEVLKEGVFLLKGISTCVEVGFLTLLESLNLCKVGRHLKFPKWPIWVVGSESHYTVLFALEPSVQEENELEECESRVRRAFDAQDQSGGGGFISYEALQQVLRECNISFPTLKLENLYLSGFIVWSELLHELLELDKSLGGLKDSSGSMGKKLFDIYHFNGIAKSVLNGNVGVGGETPLQRPRLCKLSVSVPPRWTQEEFLSDSGENRASEVNQSAESSQHAPLVDCIKTRWPRATCCWTGDAPSIV